MGLDMYFTAKRYLWDFGDTPDKEIASAIGKMFPEIGDKRVKQVEVEWMYWRKANQFHKWFVDTLQEGVDECQETYVAPEDLYPLRDLCRQVLADTSLAPTLLPNQSGFFFGSQGYDEWYFQDVEQTLEFLEDLLDKFEKGYLKGWDFYYQSSW